MLVDELLGNVVANYQFQKVKPPGGSGSVVFLCKHLENGNNFAVKVFPEQNQFFFRERYFYENKSFDNPFLVQYLDMFENEKKRVFMVMKLFTNGSLRDFITEHKKRKEKIPTDDVCLIITHLLLGLFCLHSNHVIHKDIKPDNIFMDESNVIKIGDFGTSEVVNNENGSNSIGEFSDPYVCPERIEGKNFSFAADVWSLGVCVYELCTLRMPFPKSPKQLMNICTKEYNPIEDKDDCPEFLKLIIDSMLVKDATKRPAVADVLSNPLIVKFASDKSFFKYFPSEIQKQWIFSK